MGDARNRGLGFRNVTLCAERLRTMQLKDYKELKLQLEGVLKPGEQHKRQVLQDSVYGSLPKDAEASVLVFSAEIAPGGYTNWHCLNLKDRRDARTHYSADAARPHRQGD